MRCLRPLPRRTFALSLVAAFLLLPAASAQRHNLGSSPPTAPPPAATLGQRGKPAIAPITSPGTGMGPLEFFAVNFGVAAPQSITRQLMSDDERTRTGALSAVGAPGMYLGRGRVPYPHSVHLDMAALGTGDDLDAILTVELDQHILSAILQPTADGWHRIGTMLYATPFNDFNTSPGTFLRVMRSLVQHDRYAAIFHARTSSANGDFTENEAQLRVFNNRAIVTLNFISGGRDCDHPKSGCELTHRWLQPDATDPTHRFVLITADGRLNGREATGPLATLNGFQLAHMRSFSCQPFVFSESAQRFEPIAPNAACMKGSE